jgi:hypothetical protein
MTVQSADGVKGTLIRSFDGRYYFRVYHDQDRFEDYELQHSDLTVVIADRDAFLYADDLGQRLDHSPQTLGNVDDTLRNRSTYFGNNP